jgi:hypothetical protein
MTQTTHPHAPARATPTYIAAVAASVLLAFLTVGAPAHAGTYTVTGTCGWTPWNADATRIAVYGDCSSLTARNVGGAFATAAGIGGGWRFDPPPGTAVIGASFAGAMQGVNGWQAAVYTDAGQGLEGCPGSTCPGATKSFGGPYAISGSPVVLRVRCGASSCPNTALNGQIVVNSAAVTLADATNPAVAVDGGALTAGAWESGTQSITINATDNTGIQEVRPVVDGIPRLTARRDCDYRQKVPCQNGATSLQIVTIGLTDGQHGLAAKAIDASGNEGATEAEVGFYVDNTPPTEPLDPQLMGGPGFRSTDHFALTWRDPTQMFAPITAAGYRLCPTLPTSATQAAQAAAQARCVQGTRSGPNLAAIDDLQVPDEGVWNLRLWLIDAAGNQDPGSAVQIDGLGYDDTPPAAVAFQAPDPQDPTRINVQAADPVSGIASGAIEVRRDGTDAWISLPTQVSGTGLSAVVDDETLPKGLYFARAVVVDGAGLESSNDRDAAGQPATLKLPLRLASHLDGGRRGARVCHGHGKARTCARKLLTRPRVRVGKATRLYGRLTVADQAMPGSAVQVWRRVDLDGAQWAQIATVTTSRTGRFSYLAARGPARAIRFRFPGTATIRGRNRDVELRVQASTTIRPSRRSVINGEYVIFRGKLKGGWRPAAGALVELQVLNRGQWRTFAQPRARAKSGRWAYRYRFSTVRGRASFKFRARVRAQPDFPFTTGASRPVRVSVHGL